MQDSFVLGTFREIENIFDSKTKKLYQFKIISFFQKFLKHVCPRLPPLEVNWSFWQNFPALRNESIIIYTDRLLSNVDFYANTRSCRIIRPPPPPPSGKKFLVFMRGGEGELFGYAQECFWGKNSKTFFLFKFFLQKYFFFSTFFPKPLFFTILKKKIWKKKIEKKKWKKKYFGKNKIGKKVII